VNIVAEKIWQSITQSIPRNGFWLARFWCEEFFNSITQSEEAAISVAPKDLLCVAMLCLFLPNMLITSVSGLAIIDKVDQNQDASITGADQALYK